MTAELFAPDDFCEAVTEPLGPRALLLRGFAREAAPRLLAELPGLLARSPWRHLITPGGQRMSVAMTNCGRLGWVSDRRGYRYEATDPMTGAPWPAMPPSYAALAAAAAQAAGFEGFAPAACLVNRYEPGARLSLHQDRDEGDFSAPIVSVSLGVPAVFLWGGARRADTPRRILLRHGDVVVWGGPSRLAYHGVAQVAPGVHELTGTSRINLTFRHVGGEFYRPL